MSTLNPPTPVQGRLALPGEELTRRAVTVVTVAIVAMALAFSVVNVTRLCLDLGVTAWIAWLIGPSVDLSVIGLLTGIRFLSLHGYTGEQLAGLNRFLRFCGALTLALNTAGPLWHGQYGTAGVEAIGPVLLIGWSEFGPRLMREISAICALALREVRRRIEAGRSDHNAGYLSTNSRLPNTTGTARCCSEARCLEEGADLVSVPRS